MKHPRSHAALRTAAGQYFNLATCGDMDGDGPGTEPVTDADCDTTGRAIHGNNAGPYIARPDASAAALASMEWDPLNWPSDHDTCCIQAWQYCSAANGYERWMIGYGPEGGDQSCPEGLATYSWQNWERCPQPTCNLTLGSADVDICCSGPRCRVSSTPTPGYLIDEDALENPHSSTASEILAVAQCADGYSGTPNVTCDFQDQSWWSLLEAYEMEAELSGCEHVLPSAPMGSAHRDDGLADEGDGAIDCSGINPDLPCDAMLLIDEVRDAQSLRDIDPEIFCPCKLVRDAAPNWSSEVVGSCSGSGGGR